VTLISFAPWMLNTFTEMLTFYFSRATTMDIGDPAIVLAFFRYFIQLSLPVTVTALVAGVAGNIVQTGDSSSA
jgi:flagellar biosynthetic protein FlhB